MKSYGGQFYDFMKELKFRSATRAIKNVAMNLNFAQEEHVKFLYYREQMKLWRKNVKNVDKIREKLRGKMT